MFTVTEVVTVARSRGEVFEYLSDGRNRPQWDATVISEEITSAPPVGAGSTIHTRMRVLGREAAFHWRVTEYAVPARMAIVSTAGPLRSALNLEFERVDSGCRVTATIEGAPTGMMRFVESMIADSARSTLADGLARAKAILEGTAPPLR